MNREALVSRFALRFVACGLLGIGLLPGDRASEMTHLADESDGTVRIEDERTLWIDEIRGEILVGGRPSEAVRFLSTSLDSPSTEIPVAVWGDERTIRLAPAVGREQEAVRLEVHFPASMYLRVQTSDADVGVDDLERDVEIKGRDLRFGARRLAAGLDLTLDGGRVYLEDVAGDAVLRGQALEVEVRRMGGSLSMDLERSRAKLSEIWRGADLDLNDSELTVWAASGDFRLYASGGEAELRGLTDGGTLKLASTAVRISESTGDLRIESDAMVRFHDNRGGAYVTGSYGASVIGATNDGPVQVTTYGATVDLEGIRAPVQVAGDDLEVRLRGIGAEVNVRTSSSEITITEPVGEVTVENNLGSVNVTGAKEKITVNSRNGDVTLVDVGGPVEVMADGPQVEVSWRALPTEADSRIENDGGDILVQLPRRSGGIVDASAGFGRIECDLPGVTVSDNGDRARGMMNRRSRPRLRVKADGSIRLVQAPSHREKHQAEKNAAADRLSTGASTDRSPSPSP